MLCFEITKLYISIEQKESNLSYGCPMDIVEHFQENNTYIL